MFSSQYTHYHNHEKIFLETFCIYSKISCWLVKKNKTKKKNYHLCSLIDLGHEGQLIVELELKSHLEQMLFIAGVWYEYIAALMIDHSASCLLVYQC